MPVVREPLDPRVSLWHWLAFQLRYLREKNDLTLAQVGNLIGAARSTVSNIEAGRLRIDDRQAYILDQHYGTGFLLQLLLHYARLGHDPEWFRQFSSYESQARVIKIYAGSVIPLPLQTEEYTRALLAAGRRRDIGAEAEVRMARQRALLDRDDPPWVWVVFDEAAIETWVGGRDIMRHQLKHLGELADLSYVSVRVLPRTAGAHPGQDGPFRLISLGSREVAYVGAHRGGRLIEEPIEVREIAIDFDRVAENALPAIDSRVLIERQMEAFS